MSYFRAALDDRIGQAEREVRALIMRLMEMQSARTYCVEMMHAIMAAANYQPLPPQSAVTYDALVGNLKGYDAFIPKLELRLREREVENMRLYDEQARIEEERRRKRQERENAPNRQPRKKVPIAPKVEYAPVTVSTCVTGTVAITGVSA